MGDTNKLVAIFSQKIVLHNHNSCITIKRASVKIVKLCLQVSVEKRILTWLWIGSTFPWLRPHDFWHPWLRSLRSLCQGFEVMGTQPGKCDPISKPCEIPIFSADIAEKPCENSSGKYVRELPYSGTKWNHTKNVWKFYFPKIVWNACKFFWGEIKQNCWHFVPKIWPA